MLDEDAPAFEHGGAGGLVEEHLESVVPERPFEAAFDAAVVVAPRHAQEGGLGAHGEIPVAVAGCLQAVDQPGGAVVVDPGGGRARGGGRLDDGVARAGPIPRFARSAEDELFDCAASFIVSWLSLPSIPSRAALWRAVASALGAVWRAATIGTWCGV